MYHIMGVEVKRSKGESELAAIAEQDGDHAMGDEVSASDLRTPQREIQSGTLGHFHKFERVGCRYHVEERTARLQNKTNNTGTKK